MSWLESDMVSRVISCGIVKFLWVDIVSGALYEIMEPRFFFSIHLFLWKLGTMNAVPQRCIRCYWSRAL